MRHSFIYAWCLLLICASVAGAQPASRPSRPSRNVLLLSSFEHSFAPTDTFAEVIRTELNRRSAAPINLFEASIRPAPFAPNLDEEPVVNYLRSSIGGRLDLVISLGAPAALFAQKYRDRLFPGTPLVQTALDNVWSEQLTTSNATAVAMAGDAPGIVDTILRLLPDTKELYIVIGASEMETVWRREYTRQLARFGGRLKLVWLNDLSLTEMLERSAVLPDHSAIFYLVLSIDAKGIGQSEARTLSQLHQVANAPMFGLYDTQLGQGIVGGPLMSVLQVGQLAADTALRILQGESPERVRVPAQKPDRPRFDWRELRRWGISETVLPAASVVEFRQPTIWDQYKGYIAGTVVIFGLQSLLIAGLVIQIARRRRTELALRESERIARDTAERNQDLAGRLINAQEHERTRIARDLHDDVSQQLAGVSILLSGLKRKVGRPELQPDVDQTLGSLQARTSTLADAIRNLSHQLHPSVLEHVGLVQALKRHCEEIERHHQVDMTFDSVDDVDALSPGVALCLFRVAQEALGNAVRHSRARAIVVRLKAAQDGVELEISDDGIGFVPNERSGSGLGLRSMDERVRLVGGTVMLESQPGRGTTLLVRIPLAAAQLEPVRQGR